MSDDMKEYEKLFTKRDPDYGGVGCLITGWPGCGKTNALGLIAFNEFKAGNIVLWRAKSTCQWTVLLNKTDNLVFWLKEGLEYKLIDRNKAQEIDINDVVKVNTWKSPKQLVERLNKNKINIVQTIPVNPDWSAQHGKFISEWINIMKYLCERYYSTPVSLIFDEFEDLAPEGKFFGKASMVSEMTKELRKNNVNYFGATHRTTEIFWKILNKIPWNIYMSGAIPFKKSKVLRSATNKLKQGQAIIEGQRFEWMNFKFIGKERNYRAIIKLSEKELDKLKEEDKKIEMKKNYEVYLMIYKDVKENNLSQVEAAKKYKLTHQRISQIIKDVEKNYS